MFDCSHDAMAVGDARTILSPHAVRLVQPMHFGRYLGTEKYLSVESRYPLFVDLTPYGNII